MPVQLNHSISQLMGKMIYGNEIELPPCGFVGGCFMLWGNASV